MLPTPPREMCQEGEVFRLGEGKRLQERLSEEGFQFSEEGKEEPQEREGEGEGGEEEEGYYSR